MARKRSPSKRSSPKKLSVKKLVTPKKSKEKRLCYVIMPFSKHVGIDESEWTDVYETIFKPAIESSGFGYRCMRSTITPGSFTKDIVENMKNAHVVLADITGFNGNVMWELGVRHALSLRTIMVSRSSITEKKVISDLGTYGVHFYENNGRAITKFKKEIKNSLKEYELNPEKIDNPVFEYTTSEDRMLSSRDHKMKINKLKGLLTELIENLMIVDYIHSGKYKVENDFITYYRFRYIAIDELLVSNYLIMKNLPIALHSVKSWLSHANHALDEAKENIGLNNSEAIRTHHIKYTKGLLKEIKKKLESMIDITKNTLVELKNGTLNEENEPEIVIYDKKYQKLIEDL